MKQIHTEDYIKLLEAGIYFLSVGFSIPDKDKRNFKLVNEYRVKHYNGHYVNVIEQHCLLEHDKHNNIWLALSIIDISPDQDINKPFSSRAINLRTGEIYAFPPITSSLLSNDPLTIREKEILILLSDGLLSKEIAGKLCISVNTVNTHRQRILEKLDAGNTREAIRYAEKLGMIS